MLTVNPLNPLLHILGTIDGTLEAQPLTGSAWQADQQAQAAYTQDRSVRVMNPGEDGAARKRFERALRTLRDEGQLTTSGKRIGLTTAGDTEARGLAGLPVLTDCLDLLAAIAKPDRKHRWSDGSVSESSLCGLEPLPPGVIGAERTPARAADILTAYAAPLLVARLIDWRLVAGFDGVVLYSATDAGRTMSKRGDPGKWYRTIKGKRKITLPDDYAAGWQTAYSARADATPARANLIHHLDPVDPPGRHSPELPPTTSGLPLAGATTG